MSANSAIEWTHHTFNPWRGCTRVSEGCRHCYAETLSKRNPKVLGVWGPEGTRVIAAPAYWREPLKWDRAAAAAGERHRVFCASLADVFEDRPDLVQPRAELFVLISDTPHLDWLLLTKRPENIARLMPPYFGGKVWPNVWLGTTTENQDAANLRIPKLLSVSAVVHFISAEPLLSPLNLKSIRWETDGSGGPAFVDVCAGTFCTLGGHGFKGPRLDWIIVGGESGGGARPFDLDWARDIVQQCQTDHVHVFVKQMGADPFDSSVTARGELESRHYKDKKGGDPEEWPAHLRLRQFPAVRA